FRATLGLLQRFGAERVIDTPLAEALIIGTAIGMAVEGLKPAAEIQFAGFAYTTIDQILNHAGRMRYRTRGRLSCPLVMRTPCGAGIHAPEHHSESPEAMYAHIPGIRVVYASSPKRAYGLLLAAIRDPDPVIFLEPTRLYRLFKEDVEDDGQALPLDSCFTLREGSDVTLVAWGAMTYEALAAAADLADEGVNAEVIDVATLKPLDMDTILASVAKTGRCVVVTEAARTGSFAAEIAANLAEDGLLTLLAPVQRVAGYDVVVPLPRLEKHYMPDKERIMRAVRKVVEFS
ncbi:MAG TPA: alpha-ketoacid dehydrogenase subunit beta, partial [Burkholderiales bacterium]|nr:alpha-ketoacid dehydrogenase subunit beta [Burkholderiales bacterium]